MSTQSIALIIPAMNEEEALRALLPEICSEGVRWIIVVDNASTDATASVARAAGAIVVGERERGYGRACWCGFTTAMDLGADIVVFMDGDGSDNPADLPVVLAPLLDGSADLVIGSRVSKYAEAGAILPQAQLGNWLVTTFIALRYGVRLRDVGSFRALHCSTLKALQMREMTFGWPVEMLIKAVRARHRIVEVSLRYRRRSHGHSKVAGTISGSVRAAYYMLSTMLRYAGVR